tara:strand:+ start:2604 stop:3710 length:1107 start_codon:yes stop_codon:yes gene_type:complete
MSQINFDNFSNDTIDNSRVEYLIKHGKPKDIVFFKGETGDRYTIYLFIKKTIKQTDIYTVWNTYAHSTDKGNYVGSITSDFILHATGEKTWSSWKGAAGELVKQLMRQGLCPIKDDKKFTIKFCRSSYFIKTHDKNECTPWLGMKIDLKSGLLVNKPTKEAKQIYNTAKEQDKAQRKRNYIANKENKAALRRYNLAGGDTQFQTREWIDGKMVDKIDPTIETMDWSKVPIDDVFRHRNATLRSNIIEHYGMNAILETLEHEVIDEDTIDGRKYKLLNVTIPDFSNNSPDSDSYKGLYLEMINPSTGESHFEGVPNVQTDGGWGNGFITEPTVKCALTWRDNDISVQVEGWDSAKLHNSSTYVKPIVLK